MIQRDERHRGDKMWTSQSLELTKTAEEEITAPSSSFKKQNKTRKTAENTGAGGAVGHESGVNPSACDSKKKKANISLLLLLDKHSAPGHEACARGTRRCENVSKLKARR